MGFIVAIDGPAGTGKGTVAKLLSEELGLESIDTGAMYRCIALDAIHNNIGADEAEKIEDLLRNVKITIKKENNIEKVFLDGEDVTSEIRSKKVTDLVSQLSAIKQVRIFVTDLSRKMAEGKDVIMEGRDITTVVFPNANVKIYLDAKEEERAKRRYKENIEKGINTTYEEVLENVRMRDNNDKNKEFGALKIADDAIVIDSTQLTIEQAKETIKQIILKAKERVK